MKRNSWNKCQLPVIVEFREKYDNDCYSSLVVWEVESNEYHDESRPFSHLRGNPEIIIVDLSVCQKLALTDEESFACIAHEIGHILDLTPNDELHRDERELNADKKVIELGLQKQLISTLEKICYNDELTGQRIIALKKSMMIDCKTWDLIPEERKEVLIKKFCLSTISLVPQDILACLRNNLINSYQLKCCHLNSILFAKTYERECGYQGYLVEGIAVNYRGEAFMHYWTKLKDDKDSVELDITHDLLMPSILPFLYHKVKEFSIRELPVNQEITFSIETIKKMNEYLAILPDATPTK